MTKTKRFLMTLAALFAMTAGAWADGTLQVTEIKASDISAWSGDYTPVTAADLPGFKTTTEAEAKAWAEAPASGDVILIYAFDGDNVQYVHFNDGAYNDTYSHTFSRDMIYYGTYYGQQIFYTGAPASSEPQTLDLTEAVAGKQWTAVMPAGNVTLEPEYYPQATLAFQGLTATVDAAAKTEAPLAVLADGAVTGGTLMYYVATDKNFSQADAIALAETAWSAAIPTAETIEAAGTYIMWYYIKGDAEHSDTDPVPLTVTIAAAPTYAVTFAEGTDPNEWSADPATGVTKGDKVTVTYTGTKKVIGVKAEKKAKATYTLLSAATAEDIGKVVCAAGHLHDAKTAVPDGCTAVGILGKVTATGHGLILSLQDATEQKWNTINGWTSASYAGTTLKVLTDDARGTNLTSYTALGETTVSNWAVAQKDDYEAIFTNLGTTTGDSDGMTYDANVNAYITTGVGGTAISGTCWSATGYEDDHAWYFNSAFWNYNAYKEDSFKFRPVLGF